MDQPEKQQAAEKKAKRGSGSFCIPQAAVNALIAAKADAYTIGAYLALACHTDASGQYSTASIKRIRTALSTNVPRAEKAYKALQAIKVTHAPVKGAKGKGATSTALIYTRDDWIKLTGEVLPDGAVERSKVLTVMPTFGEQPKDRVWISSALVLGHGGFKFPLRELKNCGDVAARMLLIFYQRQDLIGWGGVPPKGHVWRRYETVLDDADGAYRLIHGQDKGHVFDIAFFERIQASDESGLQALDALEACGLIYETVLVLNRNPVKSKFANGGEYHDIPPNAEPLYELHCKHAHGPKPKGEEGIGAATAKTAGELGNPVTAAGGVFYGKYAAIVPRGYGAMISSVYRLRFRVANPRNAGVKDAWARIHEGNRMGLEWVNACRKKAGLPELPPQKQGGNDTSGDDFGPDDFLPDEPLESAATQGQTIH